MISWGEWRGVKSERIQFPQGPAGHQAFGFHSKRDEKPLEGFKQTIQFLVNHVKEFGLSPKNHRDPPKTSKQGSVRIRTTFLEVYLVWGKDNSRSKETC